MTVQLYVKRIRVPSTESLVTDINDLEVVKEFEKELDLKPRDTDQELH